jgi:hypothetical protein
MNAVQAQYIVNYPQSAVGLQSFTFETTNSLGRFVFTFKWLNGQWNGWCQLPSGEVRQFGCVPDVIDWTGFTDYGIYVDSPLPVLGVNNLVGNSTLYLVDWRVP